MLVKWKTSRIGGAQIDRVECTRETAKAVWVLEYPWTLDSKPGSIPPVEKRQAKIGEWARYHDTWELAHAYLLALATQNLEAARLNLARAQGHYGNLKGMKPPAA